MGIPRTPLEVRLWNKVEKTETCWLWKGAVKEFGHGVINSGGNGGKAIRVHRVSWEIHNGPIPDGLCVCHKCDVPNCVNPAHLFLGTIADNNQDMQRKGRYDRVKRPKGERHGMHKLTASQVIEMRSLFDGGTKIRPLSQRFGVTFQTAWKIVHRMSWKSVA